MGFHGVSWFILGFHGVHVFFLGEGVHRRLAFAGFQRVSWGVIAGNLKLGLRLRVFQNPQTRDRSLSAS